MENDDDDKDEFSDSKVNGQFDFGKDEYPKQRGTAEVHVTNEGMSGTILGIISITLGVTSFFVFGWLSIPGTVLGIAGICCKRDKTAAIFGTIICVVAFILYLIALSTIYSY
ncbi:MAG: hypothetical protein WCR53_07640 [Bacteroidaceae bacterium]